MTGESRREVWEMEEALAGVDAEDVRRERWNGMALGALDCGGVRVDDGVAEAEVPSGGVADCANSRLSAWSSSSL